jgi:hypothetical protein
MELRRSDREGLNRLGALWKTTPGAEFEAMLTGLELTAWQDAIQYLRSLGMRENPQLVKLNICLSNNIRFTLEGAGVIQAYCRDNRISDKPFTAMLKESIADATPVDLGSYSAKAKLKREIPLAATDERVKDAIKQWSSLGKHFRNIQRFEFVAPGGLPLRFDVSIVRENAGRPARTFQEARVTTQPPRYEAEVELTAKRDNTDAERAAGHIIRGLSWLLQGRQRSFVLVSQQASDYVLGSLSSIFNNGSSSNRGRRPFRFPGPQPATLERAHMSPESGSGPNLLTKPGGYNVTDKADGLRCLLFVSDNGRIFLVDGGGRVYATGKQTDPALGSTVLDGEWIRRDKKGSVVSHYYAFDIMSGPGGDTRVADLPFMVVGALLGSAAAGSTRQASMAQIIGKLGSASQLVRGVPSTQNLQIGMKTFRTAQGLNLFRDAAASILEDAKLASYNTDGLIFTPNSEPLPIGRGTWAAQLKWKPPHENTIDFLVLVDRERDKAGAPTAADAIGSKYREDSGQTVRYKTLRLFVGSNKDAAFSDPRTTVLSGAPLPRSLEEGEWQAVEFRPLEPRDPMAAICYVAIGEGGSDPAGATAAATALDTNTDVIRATRTGDILQSDMIVEMAYHPERAPGWRWEPVRVRHDKTERWLAQQSNGGRKGGTMNAGWVANSIWSTIHNPVTEDAVRTGSIVLCAAPAAVVAPSASGGRRVAHRDLMKVQCLQNFHDAVKRQMLRSTVQSGNTLADLAMGAATDLNKWISANVSYVFGCDVAAAAINDPDTGAYRKVLDKMVALGSRESVPPMTFAVADVARILKTGEAGLSGEDQGLLRSEFAGRAAGGFDVVSCMFALHYMFRDAPTLLGFLNNLADLVKVGGYFVGCGHDGDSVARLLSAEKTVVGRDGPSDTWSLTKSYGSVGPMVPPTELGLGLSVDLDFISAGETRTEYLVSWPYLQERLAECGLELDRTGMFGEIWSSLDGAGERYAMTDSLRQLSFLNRWFVFRRTSDRRPAPPSAASVVAPPVLTEQKAATVALSEVPSNSASSAAAPLEAVIEFGEVEGGEVVGEAVEAPPFYVNPASAGNDTRLGPELADWPRYLSFVTRVMPDGLGDLADPAIKYPTMEAAIASAKYQKASKRPELGSQLFRVEGVNHQKYEKDREAANGDAALIRKADDAEAANTRVAAGKAKMNSGYRAEWNPEAWEAQKVDLYKAYLAERFKADERFRVILAAIKGQEGVISYMVDGVDLGPLMMELA